jgi:TonB family protein
MRFSDSRQFMLKGSLSALLSVLCAAGASAQQVPNCREPGITPPLALSSHAVTDGLYPPLSRIMNESGDSVVEYVVSESGAVGAVTVTKSSGSLRLDSAATDFVKQFTFKPASRGGVAVACRNAIMLRWSLRTAPGASFSVMLRPSKSDYPPGALKRNEEATIVGLVYVSPEGVVVGVALGQPSEFSDLNEATNAYLRAQKFKPAELNGKPILTLVAVAVRWSLTEDAQGPVNNAPQGDSSQERAH